MSLVAILVSISVHLVNGEGGTIGAEASGKTITIDCGGRNIHVTEASYGRNCNGALVNNQLINLRAACDHKTKCSYRIDHNSIGDPAPGCAKTYEYDDNCETTVVTKEASGKSLTINCGTSVISVTAATYGPNCPNTVTNNQLWNLRYACNGKHYCHYGINHNIIGDPAPGCAKDYVYDYECRSAGFVAPIVELPNGQLPENNYILQFSSESVVYAIGGIICLLLLVNIFCFCDHNCRRGRKAPKYQKVAQFVSSDDDMQNLKNNV